MKNARSPARGDPENTAAQLVSRAGRAGDAFEVWLQESTNNRAHLARGLRQGAAGESQFNLAKLAHKVVRLPIVPRALDVESLTQPVDTVFCPLRLDTNSVDNCRQCRAFRRIEASGVGMPVVCCSARGAAFDPLKSAAQPLSVQEKVRLPSVCATVSNPLGILLSYADKLRPWDVIPVLDSRAKPVGLITGAELTRLRAQRIDPAIRVGRVMSKSFATVFPCMSLADAAQLRPDGSFRGVVVVAEDETFIGIVSEPDLERACPSSVASE